MDWKRIEAKVQVEMEMKIGIEMETRVVPKVDAVRYGQIV